MLKSLREWANGNKKLSQDISYEDARDALEQQNHAAKVDLAERTDVQPEILYYLATDSSTHVRGLVARNNATPHQADKLLAADPAETVREALAGKIARLLPTLDCGANTDGKDLRLHAIALLEQLVEDQAATVRRIIAEELKSSPNVPKTLIQKLALDAEESVACPILQYSPLLDDDDLAEIITATSVSTSLAAIARRAGVTETVADKIAESMDVPAIADLLSNSSAQIREDTLNLIISNAETVPAWHEPLVHRPNLSPGLMRRLASFVAASLVETMIRDHNLDAGDAQALLGKIRTRIDTAPKAEAKPISVADLIATGSTIDEKFVINALDMNQREAVLAALAHLSNIPTKNVDKIITSKNPRRIVALAWKANLAMRSAFRIQGEIAHIPHRQLILPRNGFDYPLPEAQMEALLEPFED